jgi:hypothetical protein
MTMEMLQNQVSDESHIAPLSMNCMVQLQDFLQNGCVLLKHSVINPT